MLKKNQATKLEYKKAFIKLQSNSSRQIEPDWSNQIITIYLIGQFKPVKWYDITSLSETISYHFMGIIFIHGFNRPK